MIKGRVRIVLQVRLCRVRREERQELLKARRGHEADDGRSISMKGVVQILRAQLKISTWIV